MMKLVILGGTGDVFLVCSLIEAFKRRHNRDALVIIRPRYSCIAEMFGVRYEVDDSIVLDAERDPAFQRDYDNAMVEDRYFYTHPCFLRSGVRVDHLTTKPDASQADMYKMILRIPPEEPLARPTIPKSNPLANSVVIITQSTSWPNNQPKFWDLLSLRLRQAGWHVIVNDLSWSLKELFQYCANAEWAVGPQCGVMSILTTAEFPCRKTFVTANVDDNSAPGFLSKQTYPYGYVTKFSNRDYDVEEFKVSQHDHDAVATLVVHGSNAMRLWKHNPNPMITIGMSLAPGDFLDRFAVLTIKKERFSLDRKAAIEREFQRHAEAFRQMPRTKEIDGLFSALVVLHRETYDLLEKMVPSALAEDMMRVEDHVKAVKLNKRRIEMKREIDAHCSVPHTEVKSYHGD
jgi:hypothetical protein